MQKMPSFKASWKKLEESKFLSEILRNMLMKKYPDFSEDNPPSIDEILEWEYWPSFVRIYGMNSCIIIIAQS